MTEPTIDFRCECDTPERARYVVTGHDGQEAVVEYCDGCRELAEADWTGETAEIRRLGDASPTTLAPDVLAFRAGVGADRIGKWFDRNGWQGIGEAIMEYRPSATYTPGQLVANILTDLAASEQYHDDDPDPKLYEEARRKAHEVGRLWSQPLPAKKTLQMRVERGGRGAREFRAVLVGIHGYEVARTNLYGTVGEAAERAREEWGDVPVHPGSLAEGAPEPRKARS